MKKSGMEIFGTYESIARPWFLYYMVTSVSEVQRKLNLSKLFRIPTSWEEYQITKQLPPHCSWRLWNQNTSNQGIYYGYINIYLYPD